ncbi:MAG: cadherin domain-containing protein, partial [Alphaproteobacteria bacterium]|nr:cadherin domain-containing protein [Alphaproteobacteria bacterium]
LVVVEVLAQPAPPPTPLQFVGGMTNLSLLENNEIGINIGLFSAIAGDGIITYGVSDPLFSIDQNGRLYFQGIADYESHSRYKIFVNASNGNAVVSEMVNVFIGNENDNPIDMVVGNLNVVVNENNTSGLMLTQLVFADADGGDISYSLSDNIHFSIDDTGAIYVKGSFDYEQQSNYSLVVTATSLNQPVDGTASNIASRLVQVMVINGDDNAPLFTNTAGHVAVSENNAVGLSLGYYPAIDIDGGAMVYSVDDNNNFSIDSEGRLYFTTSAHYQQQAHYSVVITAHATNQPHTGSASDYVSQLLVVDIDQVTPPAPPTATVALHYDIDKIDATLIENNASGVWLANVAVSGSRAIATHYNGDNAAFSIDDAGNVYFLSMADFETQNTYSLVVIASNDAGEYTSELLRLKIANQNDNAPQFISGNGAVSLLENNTRGVAVGTYLAADADGGSISYSLDNNNFSLGSNGVLYFLSRANYETTAFYSVVITAHSYNQPLAGDASNSATQLVVLAIGNQNDNAPNFVNFNLLYSLPEHTAPNQQIALYSAVDADGGSISYHIIGDHSSIDQSGRVYFTDVADHNSQSLYYYTVVATSLGQPTVGAAMTESWTLGILTITNNPDYFNIYSTLDNAIWENAPRTTLGAVTGDDSMGGVLTYSVSDDHFQIDSNGMLATVRAFDHEGQKQVSALVTITSSLRPTPISQLLVFDIINSNDNPITPV